MKSLALAVAALGALPGCRGAEPGRWYRCECELLTDYDAPHGRSVEICSPGAGRAAAAARGCVQSAAPAPVQSCLCRAAPAAAPCRAGECRAAQGR